MLWEICFRRRLESAEVFARYHNASLQPSQREALLQRGSSASYPQMQASFDIHFPLWTTIDSKQISFWTSKCSFSNVVANAYLNPGTGKATEYWIAFSVCSLRQTILWVSIWELGGLARVRKELPSLSEPSPGCKPGFQVCFHKDSHTKQLTKQSASQQCPIKTVRPGLQIAFISHNPGFLTSWNDGLVQSKYWIQLASDILRLSQVCW